MSDINFLSPGKDKQEDKKKKKPKLVSVEFRTPEREHGVPSSGIIRRIRRLIQSWLGMRKKRIIFQRFKKKKKQQPQAKQPPARQLPKKPELHRTLQSQAAVPVNKETQDRVSKKTNSAFAVRYEAAQSSTHRTPLDEAEETPLSDGIGDIDVNLMPWQDPRIRRNKRIRLFSFLISMLIIGVWGTVLRIEAIEKNARLRSLTAVVATLDEQLQNIDAELLSQGSILAVQQKKFSETYYSRPVWTTFLTWLEENTEINTRFSRMTIQGSKVTLEVHSRDFETTAAQWLLFSNETNWLDNVVVSDFRKNTSGSEGNLDTPQETDEIDFIINLNINEEQLRKHNIP